jgi:hypothetical protein
MKFLKEMDLYKGIVLLSVILLPIGAYYLSGLDKQLDDCRLALRNATKKGGYLEEIGRLQKKIETVALNDGSTKGAVENSKVYFETQIGLASNGKLSANAYRIVTPQPRTLKILKSKQSVTEHKVKIEWGRPGQSGADRLPKFKMDFIYAMLFNCESGATDTRNSAGGLSVWRLKDLHLKNATMSGKNTRKGGVPDPELDDSWSIQTMVFARREPAVN